MKECIKLLLYMFIALVFSYFLVDSFKIIEGKKNKSKTDTSATTSDASATEFQETQSINSSNYEAANAAILEDVLKYNASINESQVTAAQLCCDPSSVPKYPIPVCMFQISDPSIPTYADLDAKCDAVNNIINFYNPTYTTLRNRCLYPAVKKNKIDESAVTTLPELYGCPSGGTLTSNICLTSGNPCPKENQFTPVSISYPVPAISTVTTIDGAYTFNSDTINGDVSFNDAYQEMVSAPLLL